MIYDLSRDGMAEYVNTFFSVVDRPPEVTIQLTEVTPRRATARQEIFSLVFHGPVDQFLPQRMYRLRHEQLGEFDLMLVPVGKEEDGFIYEAAFNRLIQEENRPAS